MTAVSAPADGAARNPGAPRTHAARATAWPIPTVVFVGEAEDAKAAQGSRGGRVYLYFEGRNITAASWTLGGFPRVSMHRGSDPIVMPGIDEEPLIGGTVSWVGATTDRRVVGKFRGRKRYVLRLWDHGAFAKYVSVWRCGTPSFGPGSCQTYLRRVSSHG